MKFYKLLLREKFLQKQYVKAICPVGFMKRNFKIIVEYDGTGYSGWQSQKNAKTVQQEIEAAVEKITGEKIVLTGSGRTDAGVHSYGQTANFFCNTELGCEILQRGLNSVLPKHIIILNCEIADNDFHSRYSAKAKIYNYCILNREIPSAIFRCYSWFIKRKLDIRDMKTAIRHIIGTHDFQAMQGAGNPKKSTVRIIFNAYIAALQDGYIILEFEANGFLQYMVRNIVGTLVDVGLGKTTPEKFREILKTKDRNQAGKTAPAHGLYLMKVIYR